jgi:hypothetical protein
MEDLRGRAQPDGSRKKSASDGIEPFRTTRRWKPERGGPGLGGRSPGLSSGEAGLQARGELLAFRFGLSALAFCRKLLKVALFCCLNSWGLISPERSFFSYDPTTSKPASLDAHLANASGKRPPLLVGDGGIVSASRRNCLLARAAWPPQGSRPPNLRRPRGVSTSRTSQRYGFQRRF